MRRRDLLSALVLSTTAVAGCSAPGGSTDADAPARTSAARTDTPTATTDGEQPTVVSPDPDDPVLFVVNNATDEPQTATVTLGRGDETLVNGTATLGPDESVEYDPGIDTTGTYELTVAVAGRETETWEWHVGSFAIRSGSNHFVEITPDELRFFYEE